MTVQRVLVIDGISTWVGKAPWLIIALMTVVCVEVFKRYLLNAPTAWIFDLNNMLCNTLFMLGGAYTWHGTCPWRLPVQLDEPRTQALLDISFSTSCSLFQGLPRSSMPAPIMQPIPSIDEHSDVTADGPPIYHFKTVIPIAGALVMLQGIAEIMRCVVCLRTGVWPGRLKDVAEIDVVERLAYSEYIDAAERKAAIERAQR